jgi:excisionase family DNA binding protein
MDDTIQLPEAGRLANNALLQTVSRRAEEVIREQGISVANIDVYFLAYLLETSRFGYFTYGPITIDVRTVEDIVERTAPRGRGGHVRNDESQQRFFGQLARELKRSGRKRIDELHVLLAFMRLNEGLPGRVFAELGVTPEEVERYRHPPRAGEPMPQAERLYSPEEAADYLGVHVQTVRSWVRSGRLPASRLTGKRALRIRESDLQSVLEPVDPSEFG